MFTYLATFHISDTEYFTGEEGVVVPKHVLEEHAHDAKGTEEVVLEEADNDKKCAE